MPCSQYGNWGVLNIGLPGGISPQAPQVLDNRYLIVSNSPETVGPVGGVLNPPRPPELGDPTQLYVCDNLQISGSRGVRIYLWHVNGYSNSRYFRVLLSTTGSNLAISNAVHESRIFGVNDVAAEGRCLAVSQLYGGMSTNTSAPSAISGAESVLRSYSVGSGFFLGAVHEFTVSGTGTLRVRVVLSSSSDNGTFDANVAADPRDPGGVHSPHVRGWWPFSSIRLSYSQELQIGPGPGSYSQTHDLCVNAGPEVAGGFYAENPADQHGLANNGCYGVYLEYRIGFSHLGGDPAMDYKVFVRARNTGSGGKYWGAAQLAGSVALNGIPLIRHLNADQSVSTQNAVNLGKIPVSINGSVEAIVRIAHGGSANLPVALVQTGAIAEGP